MLFVSTLTSTPCLSHPCVLASCHPCLYSPSLSQTDKPLEEALRFLKPLQLLALSRIETHLYAYRVHSKRGEEYVAGEGEWAQDELYPTEQMVLFTRFLPCSGIPHMSTSSLTLTPHPPRIRTPSSLLALTPHSHSSPSLPSSPSLLALTPHLRSSSSPLLPLFAGKFLLMLQAIRRAHAIDRDRPELHEHIVDFCCRGNCQHCPV